MIEEPTGSSAVGEAVARLARGDLVVVGDDSRRDRGYELLAPADLINPQAITFMAREARGLICVVLSPARCAALGLRMHVTTAGRAPRREFTVTVEARTGVTTGISAADRARTIRVVADPSASPRDLVTPGHIFPIVADAGGVLARPEHAEAALDLVRLADRQPAAVACEILDEHGELASVAFVEGFCECNFIPRPILVREVVRHLERTSGRRMTLGSG